MKNTRIQIGLMAPLLLLLATPGTAQQSAEVSARLSSNGQTVTAAEPINAATDRTTLKQLVAEALEYNPAVQAASHRVESLRRRVPQVKTLPDPKVSVGWNGDVKPLGLLRDFPPSSRNFGVSQTIPFPGKLKLRGEIVGREAEAAWWDYENIRRRVVAAVKIAYYNYFYFDKAIEITLKNKDLLEKLAKIAEVRYQVGKGLQQDVLRAQVELSRIEQRLTLLEQQNKTAQVRLNTLLNRDPETPLLPAAVFEAAEFSYPLPRLYQLARENDPALGREQRIIERNQFAVNLARKEYMPDFTVGYTYQNRGLLPDTQGFTFGVNIPVFYRSKQREGVNEATQALISSQRSHENRETMLHFEVKEQYLAAKAADELARLFSQAIIPQSSLALESSMAAYEVGTVDFLTMLDNFITVLDFEINYYRELTNYQMALARLEPLVGVELTQ